MRNRSEEGVLTVREKCRAIVVTLMGENELVDSRCENGGQEKHRRKTPGRLAPRFALAAAIRNAGAGDGHRLVAAPLGVDAHAEVFCADRVANSRFAEVDPERPEFDALAVAPSHSASCSSGGPAMQQEVATIAARWNRFAWATGPASGGTTSTRRAGSAKQAGSTIWRSSTWPN